MYLHTPQTISNGTSLDSAARALIMLHGRGATASSILKLATHFKLENTALLAPEATNNSWYPFSFMAPETENQPALGSALEILAQLTDQVNRAGIKSENIFFLGFSQGACLALEYTARHAKRYGGIVAFTGGLIGEELDLHKYRGNFERTPILLTTGDPDPHVPLSRVQETVDLLKDLNADVNLKVYEGRPHTIEYDEILLASEHVFKLPD